MNPLLPPEYILKLVASIEVHNHLCVLGKKVHCAIYGTATVPENGQEMGSNELYPIGIFQGMAVPEIPCSCAGYSVGDWP